jgi:membrane dipeptidase
VRSLLIMPLFVDAHCDLAWNMLCLGRDYTLSAAETRAREKGSLAVEVNGDTLLGWPDYQQAQASIIFSTLFAAPSRSRVGNWDTLCYSTPNEAHALHRQQLHVYHHLADSKPDYFRLIQDQKDLEEHLKVWTDPARGSRPVGLVVLMEGADGIRDIDELGEWHDLGLRVIGLSWAGTRYAGGTKEPGPLTAEGRLLLRAMADVGFVLDLSHMDESAAIEALDLYEGPIIASHVNCLALLPDFPTNRHLSDAALCKIIERGGIIGNVPANSFLKTGWAYTKGSQRAEVPLEAFVAHLDHVCQLAGDSRHSGIGSDFDGGFGLQSVPAGIDTVADLQKVVPLLERKGYTAVDTENILGLNWLRMLQSALPA